MFFFFVITIKQFSFPSFFCCICKIYVHESFQQVVVDLGRLLIVLFVGLVFFTRCPGYATIHRIEPDLFIDEPEESMNDTTIDGVMGDLLPSIHPSKLNLNTSTSIWFKQGDGIGVHVLVYLCEAISSITSLPLDSQHCRRNAQRYQYSNFKCAIHFVTHSKHSYFSSQVYTFSGWWRLSRTCLLNHTPSCYADACG